MAEGGYADHFIGAHVVGVAGGALLLTGKVNQKSPHRQIGSQFQGKPQIPHATMDQEKRHGRDTTWILRAWEAPEHIKENWLGTT